MRKLLPKLILGLLFTSLKPAVCLCQSDSSIQKASSIIDGFSNRMLRATDAKYADLLKQITKKNERILRKLQKQEDKLRKQMLNKDSVTSPADFEAAKLKYQQLENRIKNPVPKINGRSLNQYVPGLDSMNTLFSFLSKSGANIPGVPTEKLNQIKAISSHLKGFQVQLQNSADIKTFLQQRQQTLKDELSKLGLGNQLSSMNKQVYYYQVQVNEYKDLVNDPDKLQQKALSLVRELPAFKDFMSKNSFLAQLFGSPSGATANSAQVMAGLQTRTGVARQLNQIMAGAGSASGGNPEQYLQQQVQAAQTQLDALKDKVNKFGGSSSDMPMPDFKPNHQKTKSFWKRIEYGLNIQSQKTNALLPTTSDIALTAGYKLNDKSTIGIGASYKLGWGQNISNLSFSSQGLSLRSFIDVKMKGSVWITGGYEINYLHEFSKLDSLKIPTAWQKSGLIGLTKKYKIGKKGGNLQLLWDFLSYSQVPRSTALKFRIGYNL